MNNNSRSSLRLRRRGASSEVEPGSADESAGGIGIASVPSDDSILNSNTTDVDTTVPTRTSTLRGRRQQLSGENVAKDESRLRKVATRLVSSVVLISVFTAILLTGHVYVCALVFILEVLLFRELVTVRYNAFFDRIDQTIPLFRTTQWMWFFVALFYSYSEFAVEMIKSNTKQPTALTKARYSRPGKSS